MLLRGQYETYCCLLSTAASWKTLGLSLSQSREILMAGRGHSPVISSPRFLLRRARLHMTPRKDTEGTRSQSSCWCCNDGAMWASTDWFSQSHGSLKPTAVWSDFNFPTG